MQRNVSTHHVPLEICGRRADTHCFLCCPPNRIVFICLLMQKSAFSPQLLGSYVQIDCFVSQSFAVGICFVSLGVDTANCNMFTTLCMSVSYLSSSLAFLMFKTEFGACPTCEPSLQADPKRGDSTICGLELRVQVRFRNVSHLEMI